MQGMTPLPDDNGHAWCLDFVRSQLKYTCFRVSFAVAKTSFNSLRLQLKLKIS